MTSDEVESLHSPEGRKPPPPTRPNAVPLPHTLKGVDLPSKSIFFVLK